MDVFLKVIGVLICLSSVLSLNEPTNWGFHMPVVIALGLIVYALGEILSVLRGREDKMS